MHTRSVKVEATVTLGGLTFHPSPEAKYLGVILEQIVAKGTKYALAIAESRWGPKFEYLFTAVAAPRLDYAAIIWL